MKKENKKEITMIETLSALYEAKKIKEDQQWDDFLAWCKEQENSPHE